MLKITIQTDADFTPKGKRRARIVQTRGAFGKGRQLRWYVGGSIYREFKRIDQEAIDLTNKWLAA